MNKDRDEEIVRMLVQGKTTTEVGKAFGGLKRQRISQIAKAHGMDLSKRKNDAKRRAVIASGLVGTMPDVNVAEKLGVSDATVASVRTQLKVEKFTKPIGCEKCITDPYAKEMCKACYARYLYWGAKDS